jgi:hypothetical protein
MERRGKIFLFTPTLTLPRQGGGGKKDFLFRNPHSEFRNYFLLTTSSGWQILPLMALAAATAGLER